MSGTEHAENAAQLKLFMSPREIMQRNWSKTEPRPRAVEEGKRMDGGLDDLMPVKWVEPNREEAIRHEHDPFKKGTHGQFEPGYYFHHFSENRDIAYASSDEYGQGAVLEVSVAREVPRETRWSIGSDHFYPGWDDDPKNDSAEYYDTPPGPDELGDIEPPVQKPVQGELFRQIPGEATSLMANIEGRSRTLSLLGMAERHQAKNYGPATVSGSLTPDSFGLLKKIKGVEKGKGYKSVAWKKGHEPDDPSEDYGDMRPFGALHAEGGSGEFPSDMIRADVYESDGSRTIDKLLSQPKKSGLRKFSENQVREGKRFVREQWTSRKPRGKKIPATNKSTRQLNLFPQTAREYWEANL